MAKELRPGLAVFLGILPRFSSHLLLLRLNKQRIAMATSEQVLSIKEGVKPMKFDLGERNQDRERNERFARRRAEAGAEVSYWLYCLPARRLLGAGACTVCYRSIKCWPRRLFFAPAAATITFALIDRHKTPADRTICIHRGRSAGSRLGWTDPFVAML